ncbi:MAG: hypothetical protein ABR604_06570 [Jatrophihabitantaceae bacterium]
MTAWFNNALHTWLSDLRRQLTTTATSVPGQTKDARGSDGTTAEVTLDADGEDADGVAAEGGGLDELADRGGWRVVVPAGRPPTVALEATRIPARIRAALNRMRVRRPRGTRCRDLHGVRMRRV